MKNFDSKVVNKMQFVVREISPKTNALFQYISSTKSETNIVNAMSGQEAILANKLFVLSFGESLLLWVLNTIQMQRRNTFMVCELGLSFWTKTPSFSFQQK